MTLNQTSGDALILVYLCIHVGQACIIFLLQQYFDIVKHDF